MDLYLHTVIYQILADLESDSVHYIIYARYFFFDQQMSFYEPVHIHKDSLRQIDLSADELHCRMLLDAAGSQDSCSIIIPFDCIGKIAKVYKGDHEGKQTLLWKSETLELPRFAESNNVPPFANIVG